MIRKQFVIYRDNKVIPKHQGGIGQEPTNITLNSKYELINSYLGEDGVSMFTIINDSRKKANYRADRFYRVHDEVMMVETKNKPFEKYLVTAEFNQMLIVEGLELPVNKNDFNIIWQPYDIHNLYIEGGTAAIRKAFLEDLMAIGYEPYLHTSIDNITKSIFNCFRIDLKDKTFISGEREKTYKYSLPDHYGILLKEAKKFVNKTLTISNVGSNKLKIELTKNTIITQYGKIDIGQLINLVSFYSFPKGCDIKMTPIESTNHPVCSVTFGSSFVMDKTQRNIRLGCERDNNVFSLQELENILYMWKTELK